MTTASTSPVRQRSLPPRDSQPSRRPVWLDAAIMALVAVVGLTVIVRFAIHSASGFNTDERLMRSLGTGMQTGSQLLDLLGLVSNVSVGLCLAACVVVAMLQRRWAVAVAAGVLVAGANITTQVLKSHVLQSVSVNNSLPSGHTTVGLSLALAAVIVASYRWRPLVTAGAGLVAAFVGASTVAMHWHRPGDVLAAGMVCLGWAAVALAIAGGLQRRASGSRRSAQLVLASVVGVAAAGLMVVVVGVRPALGIQGLPDAAAAIGSLGLMFAAVVAWVSMAVDRRLA